MPTTSRREPGLKAYVLGVDTASMETLELIHAWPEYAQAKGFAAKSISNYERLISRFFIESRVSDFRQVTLQDLTTWSVTLPSQSHMAFSALRSLYKYAVLVGETDRDPTLAMPYRPQARTEPEAFTREEMASLYGAARSLDPRYEPTLRLLARTGARIGEAVAVTSDDISIRGLRLRETKRKPGGLRHERTVPLGQDVRRACDELASQGLPKLIGVSSSRVSAWCNEVGHEAGVRCHPHKFRSTFATQLAEAGVDIRTIQELLGHTSIATTMRYVAVTDERKRDAIQRLEIA